MTTAPEYKRYDSAPVRCWPKMKELRRSHFRRTWEAQARGEPLILGIVETFLSLCAGIGDFANPSYGPYFTIMMRNPDQAVRCHEAAEARGFARELCSSMRCHLGQLFTGLTTRAPSGERVKPDFVFQVGMCHSMNKTGQLASEELGVPFFVLDIPLEDTENARSYVVAQMHESIAWMEKVTARRYDDEELIKATHNEWESMVLWARISELNKNIPAPLDLRQLWSLRLPTVTLRHREECVQFYRELYDEVVERVRKGISARGFERRRLLQEGIPPFYWTGLFRQPEPYGAIFIGGEMAFSTFAAWGVAQDGSWVIPKTPRERGLEFRSRDDALRSLAELYLENCVTTRLYRLRIKAEEYLRRALDWKADGVVFHLDRGCNGQQASILEGRLALQRAGIPTMVFESSNADPRDLNQAQVVDRLESFMESMGLARV